MQAQPLYEFLKAMPQEIMSDHLSLQTSALPQFLTLLGYPGSRIYFEYLLSFEDSVIADAVVAEERGDPPWIIMEVKTFNAMRMSPADGWQTVLHRFERFLTSHDQFFVLLSPKNLGIAYGRNASEAKKLYDLVTLTEQHAAEIWKLLHYSRLFASESDDTSTSLPLDTQT